MKTVNSVEKISNHIGRFGFDLYNNEKNLVSAGQDCVLKMYDISDGGMEMIKQLNCEDVMALAISQNSNQIYLGYYEGKNVVRLIDIEESEEVIGEDIASFIGPVYQIQMGANDRLVAVSSQENKPLLIAIDSEGKITKKFMSEAHIGSCLYSCVDEQGKYALSVGCDGNIHIYQISNIDMAQTLFETSLHVTFTMVPEKEFIMQADFNSHHQIAVGGNVSLQLIQRDANSKWNLTRVPQIYHQRVLYTINQNYI